MVDDWHNFEIVSRKEIIALLRSISQKNQLIRVLIGDKADTCMTSILAIDSVNDRVTIDCPPDSNHNRSMLAATRIAFETTLDKIRILFSSEQVEPCTYQDGPALRIALPPSLIRLQRREYYRMPTPLSHPVCAIIPLPLELGGGNVLLPLADISCGGIAILDNKLILGNAIGKDYPRCRIDLPDNGTMSTTLQIRNSLELTLLNNKSNRRLGCQFIDISGQILTQVQRYITRLERERNARLG